MKAELKKRIDRQREIKNRIEEIIMQLSRPPLVGLKGLVVAVSDAHPRLKQHLERYGVEEDLSPREKSMRADLTANVVEAKSKYEKIRKLDSSLRFELADLKEEFVFGGDRDTSEEFFEMQAIRDNCNDVVNQLNNAIAEQNTKIQTLRQQTSPLPVLQKKKQEALSNKALGKNSSSLITEINKKIEQATKQAESDKHIENEILQAIEGLRSRLIAVQKEQKEIIGYLSEGISYQIAGRAIMVEMEYSKLVDSLKEKFKQLLALDKLLNQSASDSFPGRITGDMTNRFFVPRFVLPTGTSSMAESLSRKNIDIEDAISTAIKEFKLQGIELKIA